MLLRYVHVPEGMQCADCHGFVERDKTVATIDQADTWLMGLVCPKCNKKGLVQLPIESAEAEKALECQHDPAHPATTLKQVHGGSVCLACWQHA